MRLDCGADIRKAHSGEGAASLPIYVNLGEEVWDLFYFPPMIRRMYDYISRDPIIASSRSGTISHTNISPKLKTSFRLFLQTQSADDKHKCDEV